MASINGWKKVRNWWVRLTTPVIGEIRRPLWGAQAADKQSWYPLTQIELPAFVADEQPSPVGHGLDQVAITNIDQFGQFGLIGYEVEYLVGLLRSEGRVQEVLDWVLRAHRWFEMAELPLSEREGSIARIRDAHPKAVVELARLFSQVVALDNASSEEIRAILLRRVPGLCFPTGRSRADMVKLLDTARNINMWCAQRGTLPCHCPAIPDLNLP